MRGSNSGTGMLAFQLSNLLDIAFNQVILCDDTTVLSRHVQACEAAMRRALLLAWRFGQYLIVIARQFLVHSIVT